jgi:hypothetical protein
VTSEEGAYIEFLRGRGVPLVKVDSFSIDPMPSALDLDLDNSACFGDHVEGDVGGEQHETDQKEKKEGTGLISSSGSNSDDSSSGDDSVNSENGAENDGGGDGGDVPDDISEMSVPVDAAPVQCHDVVLAAMRSLASKDRNILEAGSTAFMAFLMSYQKHALSFIFRADRLDVASVARGYALIRLPRIKETKNITPDRFAASDIDTSTIPYLHKEKEEARLRRLVILKAQREQEHKEHKELKASKHHAGDNASSISCQTGTAGVVVQGSLLAMREKLKNKANEKNMKEKKIKKKRSYLQRQAAEWDELAAEETLYKKRRKGKISGDVYDASLLSAEVPAGYEEIGGDDDGDGDDDYAAGKGKKKKNWKVSVNGKIDFRKSSYTTASGGGNGNSGGKQSKYSYEKKLSYKKK